VFKHKAAAWRYLLIFYFISPYAVFYENVNKIQQQWRQTMKDLTIR